MGTPKPGFFPIHDHIEKFCHLFGGLQGRLVFGWVCCVPSPIVGEGCWHEMVCVLFVMIGPSIGNGKHGSDAHGVTLWQAIISWARG